MPTATVLRYGFAFLPVILAALLQAVFHPMLGEGVPFILFYPAVVLSAWFGGLWPGLLATILSGLIAWYVFIPPPYSFEFSDATAPARLLFFFLAGALVSFLAESLHQARRRAEAGETNERQQRQQLYVTLNSIGDGMIATNAQGRVT